ncbi:MAG: glycosyltransferase family 2 protein [Vicinamibacteria bacterium]
METHNLVHDNPPPPRLSIVLPAYNEEGNIERAVRGAFEGAAKIPATCEVVAVDDGSRDGTLAILKRLREEFGLSLRIVEHQVNLGYGVALRDGFRATRGELVFYTDSDNQFDLGELTDFMPLLEANDAALGYRVDRQDPWLRKFVSGGFNRLSSLAFGMWVRDLNCSFKLFKGDLIRALPLVTSDFFIDTELVARIHRGGYRYVQRGVRHYPRTAGRSTVRPSDVPRTLVSLVRMWFRLRREPLGSARSAGSSL